MSSGVSSTANSVCVGCGQPRQVGRFSRVWRRLGRVAAATPAARTVYAAVAPEEALSALPPTASQDLRDAIARGCCITYTVAEGHCTPACGGGSCCFHVVSVDCNIDSYECVNRPCDKGSFTTGC